MIMAFTYPVPPIAQNNGDKVTERFERSCANCEVYGWEQVGDESMNGSWSKNDTHKFSAMYSRRK